MITLYFDSSTSLYLIPEIIYSHGFFVSWYIRLKLLVIQVNVHIAFYFIFLLIQKQKTFCSVSDNIMVYGLSNDAKSIFDIIF